MKVSSWGSWETAPSAAKPGCWSTSWDTLPGFHWGRCAPQRYCGGRCTSSSGSMRAATAITPCLKNWRTSASSARESGTRRSRRRSGVMWGCWRGIAGATLIIGLIFSISGVRGMGSSRRSSRVGCGLLGAVGLGVAAGAWAATATAATAVPGAVALATEAPATQDLDKLMGLLAQRQHGHVTFVEEHFLAVLDRPVESSGELLYDAPDHLEKRTLKPK